MQSPAPTLIQMAQTYQTDMSGVNKNQSRN